MIYRDRNHLVGTAGPLKINSYKNYMPKFYKYW